MFNKGITIRRFLWYLIAMQLSLPILPIIWISIAANLFSYSERTHQCSLTFCTEDFLNLNYSLVNRTDYVLVRRVNLFNIGAGFGSALHTYCSTVSSSHISRTPSWLSRLLEAFLLAHSETPLYSSVSFHFQSRFFFFTKDGKNQTRMTRHSSHKFF